MATTQLLGEERHRTNDERSARAQPNRREQGVLEMMRRHAVFLLIAAAVLAGALAWFPSRRAGAQPECTPVAVALAYLYQVKWRYFHLTGDPLIRAAAIFNDMPPKSDHEIDTAILVNRPDGSGVLLVGFAGLICDAMSIGRKDWFDIHQKIFGIEA